MEARNWIGLALIAAGGVLQPIGWMYFLWVKVLSFILIFIGALFFATHKYI